MPSRRPEPDGAREPRVGRPTVVDDGMRRYYAARAPEYDDWWHGTGLHARRVRPGWADEVAVLVGVVAGLPPGRVLDVACGTGFLTRHLRGEVAGLDQSAEMIAIAAARLPDAPLRRAEAVPLPFAARSFDRIFTSHFYGHLRPEERDAFLAEARRVGGGLVVVDSARGGDDPAEAWEERVLSDGSTHRVYKRRFTAAQLQLELGGGRVLHEGRWFVVVEC